MQRLKQIYRYKFSFRQFLFALRTILLICGTLPFSLQVQGQDSIFVQETPKQIRVNSIYIIGNEKTEKEIILRELDFVTNYPYEWETFLDILKADQQKIFNLRLFNEVEITPLRTGPEEVEVLIAVKERWYVLPSVIFELADRNFAEWWTNQERDWSRVNYGIKVNHANVGGRNEKFRFSGQLGFTKGIEVIYAKPYIDRQQKHGLTFQLSYRDQKTVPIASKNNRQLFYTSALEEVLRKNFATALRYTFRRTFYNFHLLTLGHSSTWVSPKVLEQNPNYFLQPGNRLSFSFFQYSFLHDKRDNIAYATKGELLQLTATKYGLFSRKELDELEINVTANRYIPFGKRFHFAAGLTAGWFMSHNQPYTLVRGIGYTPNFIRGYELNVIEGQQLVVQKNSLRFQLIKTSFDLSRAIYNDQFNTLPLGIYLSGNFDQGAVRDRNRIPENLALTNQYLFGYGVGIDIVTGYDAVFRLEYSINKQGLGNFFFNFKAPF
jgi:outer membrane protein assembly factor BamA